MGYLVADPRGYLSWVHGVRRHIFLKNGVVHPLRPKYVIPTAVQANTRQAIPHSQRGLLSKQFV
jgi:hypothetical protein